MSALRTLAGKAVKITAAGADRMSPPARGVVILLYHRVGGGSASAVDLPVQLFRDQMEWLATTARVTTIDDAVTELSAPAPAPGKADATVVTFDDGTSDFVDIALPILADLKIPSLLYVATDFVERGATFPWGAPPVSWAGLRDAMSTGLVTVGSHTHTHRLLDRAGPAVVDDELDRSVDLIRSRLGVEAAHFAYPKAVLGSAPAQRAVRRRFRTASIAGTRANRYGETDVFGLARSPIQAGDGFRWFVQKATGGMRFEDTLRRLANRRRYAGAVT